MSDSLYLPSLLEILEETQLEKFWNALRDDLQITQIQHFDFVQSKDLVCSIIFSHYYFFQ